MRAALAGVAISTGCNALLGLEVGDLAGAGGGSSTGTGGGATSSSSGGTTSGTGGGSHEDCTNRVDDDGDHLIDCADPDCADYLCLPAKGLVAAIVSAENGACSVPDQLRWAGQCGDCACQVTKQALCTASAMVSQDPNCKGGGATSEGSGCDTISITATDGGTLFVQGNAVVTSPAACSAGVATAPLGAASCAVPLGGCPSLNEVCVLKSACLVANGGCPKDLVDKGAAASGSTQPSCACACQVGSATCPSITYNIFGDGSCMNAGKSFVTDGSCKPTPFTIVGSADILPAVNATSVACESAGKALSGTQRLCCKP